MYQIVFAYDPYDHIKINYANINGFLANIWKAMCLDNLNAFHMWIYWDRAHWQAKFVPFIFEQIPTRALK